jgi:hypothetical protein
MTKASSDLRQSIVESEHGIPAFSFILRCQQDVYHYFPVFEGILIFGHPMQIMLWDIKVHVAGLETNNVMEGGRGELGKSGFIRQNVPFPSYTDINHWKRLVRCTLYKFQLLFCGIVKLCVVFCWPRATFWSYITMFCTRGQPVDWLQKIITTAVCLIDLLYP